MRNYEALFSFHGSSTQTARGVWKFLCCVHNNRAKVLSLFGVWCLLIKLKEQLFRKNAKNNLLFMSKNFPGVEHFIYKKITLSLMINFKLSPLDHTQTKAKAIAFTAFWLSPRLSCTFVMFAFFGISMTSRVYKFQHVFHYRNSVRRKSESAIYKISIFCARPIIHAEILKSRERKFFWNNFRFF